MSRRRSLALMAAAGVGAALGGCGGRRVARFPGEEWERGDPGEHGLDSGALEEALREPWFPSSPPYHIAIARGGRIIWERRRGTDPAKTVPAASLVKSMIASAAGIAQRDGKLPPLDSRVIDLLPELEEARGLGGIHVDKGRHFTDDDREVTLAMLLDHTGGFMEEKHPPGTAFRYSTAGKVVLLNIIAAAYDQYNPSDIHRNGGTGELLCRMLNAPIGAGCSWQYRKFGTHAESRWELFGNFPEFQLTTGDMLRWGWLWLNEGRWEDRQIIPAEWHRRCIRVSPEIKRIAPPEQWIHGFGFWTNSEGRLWPSLGKANYLAAGAGGRRIYVLPDREAVVVMSPCPFPETAFVDDLREERLLGAVIAALG